MREAADQDGESLVTLGPAPPEEVTEIVSRLGQIAETVECDCTIVHTSEGVGKDGAPLHTAYAMVRDGLDSHPAHTPCPPTHSPTH